MTTLLVDTSETIAAKTKTERLERLRKIKGGLTPSELEKAKSASHFIQMEEYMKRIFEPSYQVNGVPLYIILENAGCIVKVGKNYLYEPSYKDLLESLVFLNPYKFNSEELSDVLLKYLEKYLYSDAGSIFSRYLDKENQLTQDLGVVIFREMKKINLIPPEELMKENISESRFEELIQKYYLAFAILIFENGVANEEFIRIVAEKINELVSKQYNFNPVKRIFTFKRIKETLNYLFKRENGFLFLNPRLKESIQTDNESKLLRIYILLELFYTKPKGSEPIRASAKDIYDELLKQVLKTFQLIKEDTKLTDPEILLLVRSIDNYKELLTL